MREVWRAGIKKACNLKNNIVKKIQVLLWRHLAGGIPPAGLLNVLPGGGNFYLASGNAADSSHWVYGMVNLLFWPISILWGVPEATIDAGNINKREMLNFYKYGNGGIPDFPGLEAAGRRTMPQQRVAPRQVPYRTQETAPRQVPYRSRYHQAPRGYYNNYQTYGY